MERNIILIRLCRYRNVRRKSRRPLYRRRMLKSGYKHLANPDTHNKRLLTEVSFWPERDPGLKARQPPRRRRPQSRLFKSQSRYPPKQISTRRRFPPSRPKNPIAQPTPRPLPLAPTKLTTKLSNFQKTFTNPPKVQTYKENLTPTKRCQRIRLRLCTESSLFSQGLKMTNFRFRRFCRHPATTTTLTLDNINNFKDRSFSIEPFLAPKLKEPTRSSEDFIRNLYDYSDYSYYDSYNDYYPEAEEKAANVEIPFVDYSDRAPKYKIFPSVLANEERQRSQYSPLKAAKTTTTATTTTTAPTTTTSAEIIDENSSESFLSSLRMREISSQFPLYPPRWRKVRKQVNVSFSHKNAFNPIFFLVKIVCTFDPQKSQASQEAARAEEAVDQNFPRRH